MALKRLLKLAKWLVSALVVVLVTVMVVRVVDSQRGPPLELWHTFVPKELDQAALDRADWAAYLAAEAAVFAEVRRDVTDKLAPRQHVPVNRYYAASPIYPGRFAQDFNRSFVLAPAGPPAGAVVLLHGLTDSPYSLRHVARLYAEHGFVALSIRLPGHGTVPGALIAADYEDWRAATRLAMREARRRAGPDRPLHIVGYSNGGALALMHALDALDDPALGRPDRIVLLSPMVGVTEFARFAGLAAWPAFIPAFAKAAWLSLIPEFNPFKYNSFPVNAARESYRLTQALQDNIRRHLRGGRLEGLAPILTFQSVLDNTVSTRAVIEGLHAHLPDASSELVLFDINRNTTFEQLLTRQADTAIERLLPPPPRPFRVAVVTNAAPGTDATEVRVTAPNALDDVRRPLGLTFPDEVYSLSHVALPFPLSDGLYGLEPDPADAFGIRLGDIAARGEYASLIVDVDMLVRMSSNPFFPYVLERIRAGIDGGAPRP
ncbi:alpha/beta hydrolase [Aquabacter spiritensis]|uniref:Serine aminopeptidase S33 family n=1 Tax=Aquabacter spiritensis TaxID=933073 RepID=A0A4V2UXV9_9HYPH|nr:alpha/beta hydrolase [Aquabacter spiritensis]TCT05018.1 serine aminopeptidase S33 family [Aquabacter spiritensis]